MMEYEKKGQIKGFLQNMNEREWKTAAAEPHTSIPASHLHSCLHWLLGSGSCDPPMSKFNINQ